MVRYRPGGVGGQMVLLPQRREATGPELEHATDGLRRLIDERDALVRAVWARFVARWGGGARRADDGRMVSVLVLISMGMAVVKLVGLAPPRVRVSVRGRTMQTPTSSACARCRPAWTICRSPRSAREPNGPRRGGWWKKRSMTAS